MRSSSDLALLGASQDQPRSLALTLNFLSPGGAARLLEHAGETVVVFFISLSIRGVVAVNAVPIDLLAGTWSVRANGTPAARTSRD